MLNRFRTLISFETILVTGEVVACVPGWEAEMEFTIPANVVPAAIMEAAQDFPETFRDGRPQPFRCHVTLNLSADTAEELIASMSDWELD